MIELLGSPLLQAFVNNRNQSVRKIMRPRDSLAHDNLAQILVGNQSKVRTGVAPP